MFREMSRCTSRLLARQSATLTVLSNSNTSPHRRFLSTASPAIALPTLEGEPKSYPPKIEKLVAEISQLTLLEVADLNELLKKSLKIADTPAMMMPMGGGMAAGGSKKAVEEDEAPVKVEKTLFTVRLMKFEETKKVALIKEVKNVVAGMNLVQAKKFVESLPQTVRVDISKDEAEKLKTALAAAGGSVEVE